jgi:hypothetical protein
VNARERESALQSVIYSGLAFIFERQSAVEQIAAGPSGPEA